MRMKRLSWVLGLCFLLDSCMLVLGPIESIIEPFEEADRPTFDLVVMGDGNTYKLQKPWNYDKSWNRKRKYPLVVSLHGGGGGYYAPCIVGADEEMQTYPCFFLSPQNAAGWGSSAAWVCDEMERIIKTQRINKYRIYLMGYSMGGSGSYDFMNLAFARNGRLFAGLVRLAGSYVAALNTAIMDKTSIWYNVGTLDTYDAAEISGGYTKGQTAYNNIKSYAGNEGAVEMVTEDVVSNSSHTFPRETKTLTLDGVEIMKLSEYEGMGHDGGTAFNDPGVLEWLFSQSLANR